MPHAAAGHHTQCEVGEYQLGEQLPSTGRYPQFEGESIQQLHFHVRLLLIDCKSKVRCSNVKNSGLHIVRRSAFLIVLVNVLNSHRLRLPERRKQYVGWQLSGILLLGTVNLLN